jgi:tRNA (uracil-5-)-methyltransferase
MSEPLLSKGFSTDSCPNKERCGSCGWSHIPYDKQLAQKLADINGSLALKELPWRCETILPSPRTAHYRNRMDFVIDFEGRVGLREKGKWWRVIDDHPCFISMEAIEAAYVAVRDWVKESGLTFFDRKAHIGFLRYAVIRATSTGALLVSVVTSAPSTPEEEAHAIGALQDLSTKLPGAAVLWSINHTITDISCGDEVRVIAGAEGIIEIINGASFQIGANDFFQTNSFLAPKLQALVVDEVAPTARVLDLYCGSGFFGIGCGMKGCSVIGVELSEESIQNARRNAALNTLAIEFHVNKAEGFAWEALKPDVVIIDPPRSGMHDKAVSDLLTAAPPKILFVSCNYKHFAFAMATLRSRYTVSKMTALDMFPHTPHVELVATLERVN